MALDEPKADDQVFHDKGLTFVMERSLVERAGDITIDYVDQGCMPGFHVQSNLSQVCSC